MSEIKELLLKSGFKPEIENIKMKITIKNHYHENFGFIHIWNEDLETVLIKGTYKDFIKKIKNSETLPKELYTKIAETITDFERSKLMKISVKAATDGNNISLTDVEYEPLQFNHFDKRTLLPFSPLTEVEYSLFHDLGIRQNTLFSQGFLSYILPETMSPMTASLFKILENVFHPLAEENSIKTLSPSVKHIFAKPYVNLNNLDIFLKTLKGNNHFFLLNYAPHLFIKQQKVKFKEFDMSFIKDTDFDTYFNDAEESMNNMKIENLLENLFVTVANIYAVFIIFFLKFNNSFSNLYGINQNISHILKLIFKTREKSLLKNSINTPVFYDTSSEKKEIHPLITQDRIPTKECLKQFASKSTLLIKKKKIMKSLEEIHNLLEIKDRLVLFCIKLFDKTITLLRQIKTDLIQNQKIKDETNIDFFEFQEILDLLNDNFFANYIFNYTFKIWQNERFASEITPSEIYEEDIPRIKTLSEKLINSLSTNSKPNSLIIFPSEVHEKIFHLKSYTDQICDGFVYAKAIPLGLIPQVANAKGYIVESFPVFSYLAEYCALQEKTVITGIRFSPMFFSEIKVKNGKAELNR